MRLRESFTCDSDEDDEDDEGATPGRKRRLSDSGGKTPRKKPRTGNRFDSSLGTLTQKVPPALFLSRCVCVCVCVRACAMLEYIF
jgi:hypothetical protein